MINLYILFATCFTAGMITMNLYIQIKINRGQSRVNEAQREINNLFAARLANLERQLPTADEEARPNVH